jgi:hypothetical protein
VQSTGKKGEEGGSVKDLPAASGKKNEEGRSGKDSPDSPAKTFAEMARAPPSRTGDGTRAEAAAAAVTAAAAEATAALRRLHARVAGSGRVALDVGKDGKCQYMCFAHQIRTRFPHLWESAADITWQQICSLLADWLAQNRWHAGVDFSEGLAFESGLEGKNWEDYVSKVREGLVLGNHHTVIAMVHVFQTPVHIWTSRTGAEKEYDGVYPEGHDSTHPVTPIEVGHVFENHYLSVFPKQKVSTVSGSGVQPKPMQSELQPLQEPRLELHGLLLELRKLLAVRPATTGSVDLETVRELLAPIPSLLDSAPPEFYGPPLAFAQEMQRLAAEVGVQTEDLWTKIFQGKSVPASRLDLAEDAAVRDKNNRENQMIRDRHWQRWKENEATTRELRQHCDLFPKRWRGGTRGMDASSLTQGKSAFRGAATKPPHSAPGHE